MPIPDEIVVPGERNKEAMSAATANNAVKSDDGKPPMGLLPWPALEVNAKLATEVTQYKHEECAEIVTINGLKELSLNIIRNNESLTTNGQEEIKKEFKNIKEEECKIPFSESETKTTRKGDSSRREDLQKKKVDFYLENKKVSAQSVIEILKDLKFISIMTISQDLQEATYVVSATTVLGSLTTVLKILQKQYGILKEARLKSSSKEQVLIELTGRHNWKKGMQWSRMYDALLRHITAFIEGENIDPESGLPHLAHAGCCLLFLATYEKMGWGIDDRWKGINND